MALSRGQFTNVISKGKKMRESYGKILSKKTKKKLYPKKKKKLKKKVEK